MKRIGIITMFYDSVNYGGVLQAYALTKYINTHFTETEAKQIPYIMNSGFSSDYIDKRISFARLIRYIRRKTNSIIGQRYSVAERDLKSQKEQSFSHFINTVPQLDKRYNYDDLHETVDMFDIFLTGSDQVWNGINRGYLLDFVGDNKKKISYAASVSRNELSDGEKGKIADSLQSFTSISVREESDVGLIQPLTRLDVQSVVDPTMLLTCDEWDCICAPRQCVEEYIFCYFLGTNRKSRKIAKEYAKLHNLKLLFIPITGEDTLKPIGEPIIASPEQFLSLIKYANCVFTDSFHAVAFSAIYKKNFVVFNRSADGEMNSRMINITLLLNAKERYCDTKRKETIKYINSLGSMTYDNCDRLFCMINSSMDYLEKSIG